MPCPHRGALLQVRRVAARSPEVAQTGARRAEERRAEFYPEAAPASSEGEAKSEPVTLRGRLQDKVARLGGG